MTTAMNNENHSDRTLDHDATLNRDATRRPQSRFAAGSIKPEMLDDTSVANATTANWVQRTLPGIPKHDAVNHPAHYTQHPSQIECIQITEHMGFCLGNAIKYIWRADLKHDAIEDLRKAVWYIEREIERRTKSMSTKVNRSSV